MGPLRTRFCQGDGTTRLPVMGPPGVSRCWGLITAVFDLFMSCDMGGQMAYREVSVIEVREVLRGWLAGAGLRTVAAQAGVDRKTARRYVQAAEAAGVVRDGGWGQVTDGVVGAVVA